MAQNIWDATLDVDNNVKQNSFDWNHTNNLTTQIGRLTPVFCDLVPAKTSFRVKPSFGLQFMPMVFPIQTRMRASISFFRYPLRALWKDYKDFVGNFRQGLEEPYINFNTEDRLKKMASTGSLGDYLGLPTTISGDYGSIETPIFPYPSETSQNYPISYAIEIDELTGSKLANGSMSMMDFFNSNKFNVTSVTDSLNPLAVRGYMYDIPEDKVISDIFGDTTLEVGFATYDNATLQLIAEESVVVIWGNSGEFLGATSGRLEDGYIYYDVPSLVKDYKSIRKIGVFANHIASINSGVLKGNALVFTLDGVLVSPFNYWQPYPFALPLVSSSVTDIDLSTSPYYSSINGNKENQIKISAYAFRAYEGIYNSFYRDNRNNPYYINGEVQYNQWIPSYEGGEDNNLYELRYANWERDFLTTAVQSPQQGQAPLVGITTYTTTGVMTNADGTSSEVPVQKVALVDESGKRYSVEFQSNDEGLTGVNYVELENGVTVRSARNLLDLATSGISIPDLRMVNCYQKFLELNMRKGYSYKEIVEGRFDVNVKYADLLLPQFFGGFSRDMNMNAITQTIDQDSSGSGSYREALGSQAGVGYFSGNTDHNIECFCDEESIIMGILVITPLPVYTQLLPKHFTYRGLLDHFNPEFNNIGFQPISYKEICPIQAYNDNPSSLNGTFGYQRPWYEYCQRYDQAHGLFRTSLSNFLMHRVFDVKPELAQSFLVIDPEQVTDVFSVTETTDKIYGQIRFDITCQLPVARVAIPRLD
nr:MAG: major capsid protein [Microviridae sp.]